MIYGIGLDIVKIERIKDAVEKWGERFLHRVFTEHERTYCSKKKNPYPSLAVRFAAKEALTKAIGARVSPFTDIEVFNDKHGKPAIKAMGKLKRFLYDHSLKGPHLSLSHEKDYGIAFVVLEKDDDR
jgi:holo-[acyl-carrier protein] synthase